MTEGDLIYIFTEWVPGGSLAAVLKKFGRLDATLVANYAEQMLQGLNHLHSHNVIHRDVKVRERGCTHHLRSRHHYLLLLPLTPRLRDL